MENIYFNEIKGVYGKYGIIEDMPLQTNLNKGCIIRGLQSGTFANKTTIESEADNTTNKLKRY